MTKYRYMQNSALVVVDMLYDFIDGSLACQNADTAVAQAVKKMIDENAELRHQIDGFRREQLASVMENIKKNIIML